MSPSLNPSPGIAGGEDIRDIRGPVPIPSAWLWALVACGALAVAAAGYGAWRVWKRRPRARIKLPFEIALEKIGAAMPLIDQGEPDAFSTAVSNAVRTYIEQRFDAKAAHRTTEEFLHDLLAEPSLGLGQYSDLLADFLKHCDLAKFARWPLTADEMRSMADSARKFVLETRPAPEGKPDAQKSAAKPEEVAV